MIVFLHIMFLIPVCRLMIISRSEGIGGRMKVFIISRKIIWSFCWGSLVILGFFLSIHANWSRLPTRKGAVVFYAKQFPMAQLLADNIQQEIKKVITIPKLARHGNYYILKQAKVPAIIIELGYLTNPEEYCLLQKDSYYNLLTTAIICGLGKNFSS